MKEMVLPPPDFAAPGFSGSSLRSFGIQQGVGVGRSSGAEGMVHGGSLIALLASNPGEGNNKFQKRKSQRADTLQQQGKGSTLRPRERVSLPEEFNQISAEIVQSSTNLASCMEFRSV
ncbi:hypothetical protein L1987_10159 [Smallanthus sonchifolius]|uniref:Uncharacterized protein n=1 Tax=Smallanthus sonchifolius TaxID=185202 RepID=A0ACB9JRB7_9ASTR|nr:hypothetical protein L1987_10159 [Smallanthus sonchifolius]